MRFIKIFTIFIFLLVLPITVSASELYLEAITDKFGPGDNFGVNVKINTNGICVNTADIYIEFPQDYIKVKDFLSGESVLSLWVDKPGVTDYEEVNNQGLLHFSGGIPGGYCGSIPGDPGESNILGRIVFESPSFVIGEWNNDNISVRIGDESRVLLNDGLGTADALSFKDLMLEVHNSATMSGNEYLSNLRNDNLQPEPFVLYLQGGNSAFNGANYVEFNTTDKQTGVDHYEILEIWENEEIGVPSKRSVVDYFFKNKRVIPEWKVVESPYLLQDQALRSIIRLKAVDKAGNERYVDYIPKGSLKSQQSYIMYRKILVITILLVIAIVVLFFFWLFIKRLKVRREERLLASSEEEFDVVDELEDEE